MGFAFRLFGFPVRIEPGFIVLVGVLLLVSGLPFGGALMLAGVVLGSVLTHELGHALAAARFGLKPIVVLHALGGTTSWVQGHALDRRSQILVALAGPVAGYLFGLSALLVYLVATGVTPGGEEPGTLVILSFWAASASLLYSTVNLVPVLPFDGGRILAVVLGAQRKRLAASLSLACGMLLALACFAADPRLGWIAAAVFGMGSLREFLLAEQQRWTPVPSREQVEELLVQAHRALGRESYDQALAMARAALGVAADASQKQKACELIAWATLSLGDPLGARAAVQLAPQPDGVDAVLAGAILEAAGQPDQAADVLHQRRAEGDRRPEVAASLVRALLGSKQYARAVAVAHEILAITPESDVRRVAREAFAGGAAAAAAGLWRALFEATGFAADAYDAARGFARAGQQDEALGCLSAAAKAGLKDAEAARQDADLQELSRDKRFEAALTGASVEAR